MKPRRAAAGGTLKVHEKVTLRRFVKMISADDDLLRAFIRACAAHAQRKGAKRKGRI
jgi:hypothetical protein